MKHAKYIYIASAVTICLFQIINNIREVDFFGAAHFVWDYSLGFVKRGFAGEVLERVLGQTANDYRVICMVAFTVLLAFLASYIMFTYRTVAARSGWAPILVALSGLLLQPVIPALIFDTGRLDQINCTLAIIACELILTGVGSAAVAFYVVASSVAILVHEGFLIQQFPIVTALLVVTPTLRHGNNGWKTLLTRGLFAAAPLLTFFAVWRWGAAPVSQDAWIAHWVEQAPFVGNQGLDEGGALLIHFKTIEENIHYTMSNVATPKTFIAAVVMTAILWLTYFFCWNFLKGLPRWAIATIMVSALSPVLLFFLGVDYLRWTSNIAFNLSFGILCLIRLAPRHDDVPDVISTWAAAGNEGSGVASVILASVAVAYLMFPQSTGVVSARPLPEPFRCFFGVRQIKQLWPQYPEMCLRHIADQANRLAAGPY